MSTVQTLIPPFIFCPKCGGKIEKQTSGEDTEKAARDGGYVEAARFICKCGVYGLMMTHKMPESPTFTLIFDIYRESL